MNRIEHLVILMMENRSFDHMLGSLSLLEGRKDVNGLKEGMSNPGLNGEVPINNLDGEYDGYPDPPHGPTHQSENWNKGKMDGFVQNYLSEIPDADKAKFEHVVMGYYTRATLPVLYNLADNFTICDRWFSSMLSSTWPNRKYFISGKRDDDDDTQTLPKFPGFKTTPFLDPLEDWTNPDTGQKCTWKCYFTDLPFLSFWYPFAATHALGNFRTVLDFAIDCRENNLPTVSLIDPAFGLADDHPSYDIRRGQKFLGLVVDALTHSDSWKNTALVLLYDENGAFFDHVAPPDNFDGGPQPDGDLPFGFRTPTVVISPYSKRQCVHTTFDHTSIMKSINVRWGVPFDPAKFGNRWTMAPDIWSTCFNFDDPAPLGVGNYTSSESLSSLTWEHGIHDILGRPPGGVLSLLERVFALPSHGVLDNRAKMFDTLNNFEREVVNLKRLVP